MFRRLAALACASLAMIGLAPAPAHAVDVYTTPGRHNVNGREWRTSCEKYSSKVERCRTDIRAHQALRRANGTYAVEYKWVFNNLTYKTSPRAHWERWNPLVTPGRHTIDNRQWKTECSTSWTGSNGCRSQIFGTVVEFSKGRFSQKNTWVFNNIVVLSPIPCPVSQAHLRTQTRTPGAVIQGCTQSRQNSSWTAVDHSVEDGNEISMVTTIWKREGRRWVLKASSGRSASHLCTWFSQSNLPRDLTKAVPYCFR